MMMGERIKEADLLAKSIKKAKGLDSIEEVMGKSMVKKKKKKNLESE